VDCAQNGQLAIEMCRATHYDLILMDIQMPVMDGYEATRKIRVFNPEVPILALTASALSDGEQKARECGMNDFITKPIHPNELFHKIQMHTIPNFLHQ
jgi:CheY-like chemotaxis protein